MKINNSNKLGKMVFKLCALVLLSYSCKADNVNMKVAIPVVPAESLRTSLAITYMPEIEYPELPLKVGIEGIAVIQCLIDTNGSVINTVLVKSSGNDILDSTACKAVALFKFSQPKQDGKAVRVTKQIGIKFHHVFKAPKGEVSIIE